ncbi:glycosyltransferase [Paracoccaceae bacterium]|nr:glycosyltransferase [Paracoccaceae bacterium]
MVLSDSIYLSNTEEENKPLISIIVNCYNGEKYLREAIDSVLSQSYKNWELIFWDNQSNDNSAEIFREYIDHRLHYCYAPNHTRLYEARNYAYEQSKGEFIAFLDVDDWWEPTKLEDQIKLFSDHCVGLVYSNFWIASTGSQKLKIAHKKTLPSGFVLNEQLKSYTVGMLTIMVRRSSLDNLDYIFDSDYQIIGDFDLVVRLAVEWKFVSIQRPSAYYRMHDNNMSKKYRHLQIMEMQQWIEKTQGQFNISNNTGYEIRKKFLFYYQGLESIEKNHFVVVFKLLWKLPWVLRIKLIVKVATSRSILKIIRKM